MNPKDGTVCTPSWLVVSSCSNQLRTGSWSGNPGKPCHHEADMGKACRIIRIGLVLALAWYRGIMEILCDAMSSPSGVMEILCDAIIHLAQEGASGVISRWIWRF